MKCQFILTLVLLLSGSSLFCGGNAIAQETSNEVDAAAKSPAAKQWYYGPTTKQPEPKALGRQRALHRAQQRQNRMETMRWYGFSASRPTATGIPFTSMYSPQWTRPGGRPYAWYTSQRPVVVVSPYFPSYYR